jgi:hypothetical protein
MVYFDTDSGAPYNGTSSVLGDPSPVKVGTVTSTVLEGLYRDSTYYIAVRAFDRSGNASEYSNQWQLDTRFNNRPVLYARVFNVDPLLSPGSVVDTLWAYDEDRDQELRFFLAETNTCDSYSVDSVTGEVRLLEAYPLGHQGTGYDSCRLYVGVRDNGPGRLADSTEILLVMKISVGLRRAPLAHELRFKMYPNPAKDELNIQLNATRESGDLTLSIVNLQGQTVWRQDFNSPGTHERNTGSMEQYRIDLSHIPPGLYSVAVQTEKERGVQRLVITR